MAACMIAFALYLLLSEQKRGQTEADKLSLSISKQMNEGDRIGQMNNLIVRNRELVFASRQMEQVTESNYLAFASPLANQLLNEAVTSAVDIEKERRNQIGLSQNVVRDQIEKYNIDAQNTTTFKLPWWQSYQLHITDVNGGSVKDVQSNVEHTEIYADLNDFDKQKKYFQPGSNLYFGNINAKLPAPDNNIDFKITSLPAAVDKNIAPARMVNPEVYKFGNSFFENGKYVKQSFDQIPTAVQVLGDMDVKMNKENQTVKIGAASLTNGAQPLQSAFDAREQQLQLLNQPNLNPFNQDKNQ